ncbi:hypothetical protein GRI44_08410 [Altererythrobacter confluentis]|uniref:Putative Flp pilus-assembly TadG-like N-terminal domain-containing protein n=1 Tax=Allopontixanthobacter confluentis TaxID=1849021 RepID=A0A6L7GJG5_9SPHN|nr:pilus assembly protein TadG-related protein [Allopontixanthobacter confluentis]MXP14771.1 hypothetical protein [Allopontixanthobacter confluentis]
MAFSVSTFFRSDESGAISAMYAIAILPLVVMAGVAFDYGRMMGLDTELQNAADQAALAAATQLDGSTDAITNSQIAAANALGNQTRFANDGGGRAIPTSGLSFVYFNGYEDDAPVNETTVPEDAKVVLVNVEDRAVRYALTPVMATFSGGVARSSAMATLQTATCNVPPLMFCVPNTALGTADRSFPRATDIGSGMKLHFKSKDVKDNPNKPQDDTIDETDWAPGNFGFLDLDYYKAGKGQNSTTGLNSDFLGCTGEPPKSNPGFRTPEGSALNSRFDIFPAPTQSCNPATGDFCPSQNTTKNRVLEVQNASCDPLPGNGKNTDFEEPPAGLQPPPSGLSKPGYPQDNCFNNAILPCNVTGDGNWSADTWLNTWHGTSQATILATSDSSGNSWDLNDDGKLSRYEVYEWELADKANRLKPKYLGMVAGNNGQTKHYCAFPQPKNAPPGVPSGGDQKDRRIITVAAVDCTNLNGKNVVDIVRWVDLFLVQPVNTTADDRNFFTEIKGPAAKGGDRDPAFQYYGRRKAVLLR